MMKEDILNKTLQTIIDSCNPQKVLLFGSAVKDTFHNQSDLDFLIVVDDNTDIATVYQKLNHEGTLKEVDLIVRTTSEFEENRTNIAKIDLVADLEGKLIYKSP